MTSAGRVIFIVTGYKVSEFYLISYHIVLVMILSNLCFEPGRIAQSVGHLTRKSGVLGSIPGLATYFRFSFRFFKKGSCQLLAKVCARSTGEPLRRSKPALEKCG